MKRTMPAVALVVVFALSGCGMFTAKDAYDVLRLTKEPDTTVTIHKIELPDTVRVKIITGE